MPTSYDRVVVGAGILGLAVARELLARHPDSRVAVVDKADRVAAHQTSHNSGVIHAGVYYAPGSLKARLCVKGAALMYEYCERQGIDVNRIGKLIIATGAGELPGLDELERRARANGVPGIRRIGGPQIREIEPHAIGVAALHSPNTGIVDFRTVCDRLAADVTQAGAELRLGWPVRDVLSNDRKIRLIGPDGDGIEAAGAVFCAGAVGRPPRGPRRAPLPTRGSSRFAGVTCACAPSGAASSTGSSIRSPIPRCRSSEST